MNVTREQSDALNAVVKIRIAPEDYEPRVNEVLRKYRKTARVDGFRVGYVPEGLIRKMYGKYTLADEVNKLVSESLGKYIEEEKLNLLGEPIPSDNQEPVDFDQDTEFEFSFDLGLSPEVDIALNKDISMVSYVIQPASDSLTQYTEHYTRRYGAFESCGEVEEGKEMVRGDFVQLDASEQVLEEGITAEDTAIYLEFVKDEETRNRFIGLKAGDALVMDVKTAFPNDVEIASMLRIGKDKVAELSSSLFRFTLRSVSRFRNAEVDQNLFDKVYGEGIVTSREEFESKIMLEVEENMRNDSLYRFRQDAKEQLLKMFTSELPSAFLKRWLFAANQGKFSVEDIEKDYVLFEKDLRWQLIQNQIIRQFSIKAGEDEILEFAKQTALAQYRQYGIFNVPDEHLLEYAKGMLSREQEAKRLFEKLYEEKVYQVIREQVSLDEKTISFDEFNRLAEADE